MFDSFHIYQNVIMTYKYRHDCLYLNTLQIYIRNLHCQFNLSLETSKISKGYSCCGSF